MIIALCKRPGVEEDPPVSFNDTDEDMLKYKEYIKQANRDIIKSHNFNFKKSTITLSTAIGQREYDKTGNIDKVYYNKKELSYIDDECLLEDISGYPIGYYISQYENKIGLHYIPDNVYSIKIRQETESLAKNTGELKDDLELETDYSLIPSSYHDLIVMGAELIYIRDKVRKNISKALNDYNNKLADLIVYDRGTTKTPIFVMG